MSVRDHNTQAPTVGFSNTLNRGHDDSDVNYLTAALSWYLGGPAGEDVKAAWDRILDRLGIPKEVEQPTRAPDPAVAVLEAEVARLRGALQSALTFIEDLAGNDLDETAADGGVTVGMVMQQQASTVFGPRLLAALNPAPSEKEAG